MHCCCCATCTAVLVAPLRRLSTLNRLRAVLFLAGSMLDLWAIPVTNGRLGMLQCCALRTILCCCCATTSYVRDAAMSFTHQPKSRVVFNVTYLVRFFFANLASLSTFKLAKIAQNLKNYCLEFPYRFVGVYGK